MKQKQKTEAERLKKAHESNISRLMTASLLAYQVKMNLQDVQLPMIRDYNERNKLRTLVNEGLKGCNVLIDKFLLPIGGENDKQFIDEASASVNAIFRIYNNMSTEQRTSLSNIALAIFDGEATAKEIEEILNDHLPKN